MRTNVESPATGRHVRATKTPHAYDGAHGFFELTAFHETGSAHRLAHRAARMRRLCSSWTRTRRSHRADGFFLVVGTHSLGIRICRFHGVPPRGNACCSSALSQIAASAFLINFRHVFYALSFPLHRLRGTLAKAYATYALTDEAYALTTDPQAAQWSQARIMTIVTTLHLTWILSVTAGAGLGLLIPPGIVGLDFAVTALFVVLGIEAFRARPSLPVPITAIICALAARVVSRENMLILAMGFFVVCLTASFTARRVQERHKKSSSPTSSNRGEINA